MNAQIVIKEFIDRQKAKGISDNDLEETLFVAVNVTNSQASKELKKLTLPDSVQEVLKQIRENPRELFNLLTMEKLSSEVVNEKKETIMDVYARHLKHFLDQL